MPDNTFRLPDMPPVTMTGLAAERLISGGSGDAALLYIYILKNHGEFTLSAAASALKMPEARVSSAVGVLASLGLLTCAGGGTERPREASPTAAPADELPQYDARDIREAASDGGQFSRLVDEVQRTLGKILSSADLIKLFGIYDHLGLPPEVILTLISYCTLEYRRRYGGGGAPTMRCIEATAFAWERAGAVTIETAEDYMRRTDEHNERLAEIRRALGTGGRPLSRTEREYIEKWLAMGHRPDAVALAYDRTVTQTGKLAWKYMDKILSDWHAKGLHTAREAESGDRRSDASRKKTADKPDTPKRDLPDADEIARMKRALDEIRNG